MNFVDDEDIFSNLVKESSVNKKATIRRMVEPYYMKTNTFEKDCIDPNEDIILFKDNYEEEYKCIPYTILSYYKVIVDSMFDSLDYYDDATVIPATITYCPYSKSAVIYKGIWSYTGYLYKWNIVLTEDAVNIEDDEQSILPQIMGKVIHNHNIDCITLNNYNNEAEDFYPPRYVTRTCKWGEWINSDHYDITNVLDLRVYYDIKNYDIRHIKLCEYYKKLSDGKQMGFGFFDKKNNEGFLFISKESSNLYIDDIGMIIIPKKLRNTFFVECNRDVWTSYFPFSETL